MHVCYTEECNLCGASLKGELLVDGRTYWGRWAVMCVTCHALKGEGLGTGRGQMYRYGQEKKVDG